MDKPKKNRLQWHEFPLVLTNEHQFSYVNDGRELSHTSYANYWYDTYQHWYLCCIINFFNRYWFHNLYYNDPRKLKSIPTYGHPCTLSQIPHLSGRGGRFRIVDRTKLHFLGCLYIFSSLLLKRIYNSAHISLLILQCIYILDLLYFGYATIFSDNHLMQLSNKYTSIHVLFIHQSYEACLHSEHILIFWTYLVILIHHDGIICIRLWFVNYWPSSSFLSTILSTSKAIRIICKGGRCKPKHQSWWSTDEYMVALCCL